MTRITRALPRALTPAAVTAAALFAGMLAGAAPASAHVHVDSDDTVRGEYAVLTFKVPGESDTGALTTKLTVALPNGMSARSEVMPGWTATLDRDVAAGTVRSVTWTAAPGVGISPDQFAMFRLSVKLPDSDAASFPATQTYSDGTVVHWDQPPLPNGDEPEHPVPALTLTATAAHPGGASAPAAGDIVARWLGGAGVVVGLIGVALAVVLSRRRST